MRIGIVGANGFIGKHLFLGLVQSEDYVLSEINRDHCADVDSLSKKTKNLDVLVVAGGVNRADSEDSVYTENIKMVKTIIATLSAQNYKGRLIFLSSIQNVKDNAYGRAKRDSEELLKNFSNKQGTKLSILVLPNIFGESQKPYYNCVVPTFIYQILQGQKSQVADAEVELLHVRHVVELVKDILRGLNDIHRPTIRPKGEIINVSDLHKVLTSFNNYKNTDVGIIPDFVSVFNLDLFNTFRYTCWVLQMNTSGYFLLHEDERGYLIELVKTNTSGQVLFSTTKPGFVRGGHFHTRKVERFCLLSGKSRVSMMSVFGDFSEDIDCVGGGGKFVDIPNYTIHKMENIGEEEVVGVFWINEIYNPEDGDTYNKVPK